MTLIIELDLDNVKLNQYALYLGQVITFENCRQDGQTQTTDQLLYGHHKVVGKKR